MTGAISNYYYICFQTTEHMLAYSLRKALKFYLFSTLKSTESSCQEIGGGSDRVVPHDFMQRPHAMCKAQLDAYVGLYSEPSIISLRDTELQSVP